MSSAKQQFRSRLLSSPLGPVAKRLKDRIYRQEHRLLFFFNGASGEWTGMGQHLYATEPVFRESIERCSTTVEKYLGFEIASHFSRGASRDNESQGKALAQSHNFMTHAALQIAQCDLWRSQGIVPDGVISMSLGECTAAYVAGALTLEDSVQVACSGADVAARIKLQNKLLFADCNYQTAQKMRQQAPVAVEIFGEFSPRCTLLCVTASEYPEMKKFLKQADIRCPAINSELISHTSHVSLVRKQMEQAMAGIQPQPLTVPFYSAFAGSRVPEDMALDWLFWHSVLRYQCRLGDALRSAFRDGYDTLLNIGARPTAGPWIEQNREYMGHPLVVFDSMCHDAPEKTTWEQAGKALRARGFGKPRETAKGKTKKASPAELLESKFLALDAQFMRDPYPYYAELRREGPIHYFASQDFWLVVGYEAATEILLKADKFSNAPVHGYDSILEAINPPEHTRIRRVVSRYFSASKMQDASEYANRTARELLEGVKGQMQFDALSEFATPLAERVLGHFLGMSEEMVAALNEFSHPFRHDAVDMLNELRNFFYPYVEAAQCNPGTDFCSQLVMGQGEEEFSLPEVAELMSVVWVAGTHTTNTLIPELLLLLVGNPTIREQLQSNGDLIPGLVEEALRLSSPVHNDIRIARETTTVGGVTIPKGATVKVCLGAANRDPAHFPDPDCILLERNMRAGLMFGNGIHRCVGATLARVEARAVIEALFKEMPNFGAGEPPRTVHWNKSIDVRGLESLAISPEQ